MALRDVHNPNETGIVVLDVRGNLCYIPPGEHSNVELPDGKPFLAEGTYEAQLISVTPRQGIVTRNRFLQLKYHILSAKTTTIGYLGLGTGASEGALAQIYSLLRPRLPINCTVRIIHHLVDGGCYMTTQIDPLEDIKWASGAG